MPLHFDGWTFRPEAAVRETWYGKSQFPADLDQIPVVTSAGTTRTDMETGFDFRPPVLERDFSAPWLGHLLGGDLRHTIEPDVSYQLRDGDQQFPADSALRRNGRGQQYERGGVRSDAAAVFAESALRIHARARRRWGRSTMCGGGTRDWISWRVAQKYYFEPDFDHAHDARDTESAGHDAGFYGHRFPDGGRVTTRR